MAKRSAPSASKGTGKRKFNGSGGPPPKRKREIVFDPEARKAYLRGFSERKRERRAYGLAMQKVKDRKARLEERKQARKDELQRIEEAEKQKAAFMEQMKKESTQSQSDEGEIIKEEDIGLKSQDEAQESSSRHKAVLDTKTYDDKATETHWGGHVTVTTSVVHLGEGESSDDDEDSEKNDASTRPQPSKNKTSVDRQQQNAGNVEKFMTQLKGNMPGKKSSHGHHAKRKGKNGAADMKGIGGASNLKVAQKVLSKARAKQVSAGQGHKKGGKKKKSRG